MWFVLPYQLAWISTNSIFRRTRVSENADVGRFMVATRDIEPGEIVLLDRAVVVAPEDKPGNHKAGSTKGNGKGRQVHSVFFIRDSLKMSLECLLNFSRISLGLSLKVSLSKTK